MHTVLLQDCQMVLFLYQKSQFGYKYFGVPYTMKKICGFWVYFKAIKEVGNSVIIWYIIPVLVHFTKKNLATMFWLLREAFPLFIVIS
jgi:hypothetical protein